MVNLPRKPHADGYIKKIEYIFFNRDKIIEEVIEVKLRRIYPEVKTQSGTGDPTATEAFKNLTPLESVVVDNQILYQPEQWLEVAEKTFNWCISSGSAYSQIFIDRYTDKKYFVQTITQLEISTDQYYKILNKIRNRAALIAAWHHLINV